MFKEIFGSIIIILIAMICGIIYNDRIIGSLLLSSGMLNIWLAILNKNYNYIFGALFYLFNTYISYINGLYGCALLSLFVYFPLQIDGFIRWRDDIPIKSLSKTLKIFITTCLITSTISLTIILNMIPHQSLALLDSTSNIANICGIILMNLKYKQAWNMWLINNIVDLLIWFIKSIQHKPNSLMMLFVSIGYLLLNLYGIYKWKKLKI